MLNVLLLLLCVVINGLVHVSDVGDVDAPTYRNAVELEGGPFFTVSIFTSVVDDDDRLPVYLSAKYLSMTSPILKVVFCYDAIFLLSIEKISIFYYDGEGDTRVKDFEPEGFQIGDFDIDETCSWLSYVTSGKNGKISVGVLKRNTTDWNSEEVDFLPYQILDNLVVNTMSIGMSSTWICTIEIHRKQDRVYHLVHRNFILDGDVWNTNVTVHGEFEANSPSYVMSSRMAGNRFGSVIDSPQIFVELVYNNDNDYHRTNTTFGTETNIQSQSLLVPVKCMLISSLFNDMMPDYCFVYMDEMNSFVFYDHRFVRISPTPYLFSVNGYGRDFILSTRYLLERTSPGYQSEFWKDTPQALPCPLGTFKNSSDALQCNYCGAGEYQNETGSTHCKTCKKNEYCSIGSINPLSIPPLTSTEYPFDIDQDRFYSHIMNALLFPIQKEIFKGFFFLPIAWIFVYSVFVLAFVIGCILFPLLRCQESQFQETLEKLDLFDYPIYDQPKNEFMQYKSSLGIFLTLFLVPMMIISTVSIIEIYSDYSVTELADTFPLNEGLNVQRQRLLGSHLQFSDNTPDEIFRVLSDNVKYSLEIELLNCDQDPSFTMSYTGCRSEGTAACNISFRTFFNPEKNVGVISLDLNPPHDINSPVLSIELLYDVGFRFTQMMIKLVATPICEGCDWNYVPFNISVPVILERENTLFSGSYEFDIQSTKVIRESSFSMNLFQDESIYQGYIHLSAKPYLVRGYPVEQLILQRSQVSHLLTLNLNENEMWIKEKEERKLSLTETFNVILLVATVFYNVGSGIIGIHKKIILFCQKDEPTYISLDVN